MIRVDGSKYIGWESKIFFVRYLWGSHLGESHFFQALSHMIISTTICELEITQRRSDVGDLKVWESTYQANALGIPCPAYPAEIYWPLKGS